MARIGRKYLVLDTETATLPFVNGMVSTVEQKRTLAIAKPLIYDIAWKVIDRNGKVYSEHSYLVSEIFSVPSIFNTAYYEWKRPIYLERLNKGETTIKNWNEIIEILKIDLEKSDFVGAFNSMFDYKKAIPFMEKYISALYSPNYFQWENKQKESCKRILRKEKFNNPDWDGKNFILRDEKYPLIDLWGIACEMLINTDTYKRKCLQHSMLTESGQYFKSSAETTFRYLCNKYDFEEMHLAIDDVNIECEILRKALKKGKITEGLQYFPFQMLGKTTKYIISKDSNRRKIPVVEVENVIKQIEKKLETYVNESSFSVSLEREMRKLITYLDERYRKDEYNYYLKGLYLDDREINRQIEKLIKVRDKMKSDKGRENKQDSIDILLEEKASINEKIKMAMVYGE